MDAKKPENEAQTSTGKNDRAGYVAEETQAVIMRARLHLEGEREIMDGRIRAFIENMLHLLVGAVEVSAESLLDA